MQFSEHFGIECVTEVSIYMVCFLVFVFFYSNNTGKTQNIGIR